MTTKAKNKTGGNNTKTDFAGGHYISSVKKSIDGLRDEAAKLPEGKKKTEIYGWLAEATFGLSNAVFMLSGGVTAAPIPVA